MRGDSGTIASKMRAKRDVKIEHLREVPLFDDCSDADLDRVARLADEVAVPSGYVIVYEGDWGDEVYVVAEGEATVAANGRVLAVLGAGEVIGELAALDPAPRIATVAAATPMRFFVFERAAFLGLLDDHPNIARRTMFGMTQRFREVHERATPNPVTQDL